MCSDFDHSKEEVGSCVSQIVSTDVFVVKKATNSVTKQWQI